MNRPVFKTSLKAKRLALGSSVVMAVAGMNAPAAVGFAGAEYHQYVISQPGYKAQYGSWSVLKLPTQFRVNAIHASLLRTGKVLIIAGSGNDANNFKAGTFKTLLWDPVKETYKLIPTPADMFCSGHAQLPDGSLLVAGGTLRYEQVAGTVTVPGGTMEVRNEDPNKSRTVRKGTVFTAPDGRQYKTDDAVVLPAAAKSVVKDPKAYRGVRTVVTPSQQAVWVDSLSPGTTGTIKTMTQFHVKGLTGNDGRTLYGMAKAINLGVQNFQGIKQSYVFNPDIEQYELVQSMEYARWYPTLAPTADGKVIAVSGLDGTGVILNGENEIFDPTTRTWSAGPTRFFATYPALFLTASNKLFYSGSNAGYGNAAKGRTPGLWDLKTNTFQVVPGLKDPQYTETSSSLLLPPAQAQKVMFLGGGGAGESAKGTARTAVVDLTKTNPSWTTGPDLPAGQTRYLSSVILPNDTVLTTGGSHDYRGKHGSDILKANIYHPDTNTFSLAADPTVGRDYHSEALLLPDGRVVTMGSNPLFGNKQDVGGQFFEQRIEIYTPAYLYHGARPAVTGGPAAVSRGQSAAFTTTVPTAGGIGTARLMRPSSVTHATDVQQRSIALDVTRTPGGFTTTIPSNAGLVPSGWYMLFITDRNGTPSVARWVQVR
ncbi:uncharacterized protein DUF1929 [Streptomyces sp. 846.5]|nr:uncharacterized protein DUF1929 [Streptomyces sp. 846.5]